MTPHNEAKKEDIAKIVLMPGDPLRAKYIAENFLENAKLVNTVRNMFGYTGTYKGKKITVFASGMGMPSMGIYCYELYKFYEVDTIIRIGSCGTFLKDVSLLDTILVEKSYTEGNFALAMNHKSNLHLAQATTSVNKLLEETASEKNIAIRIGTMLCNEYFDPYIEDINPLLNRLPKELNCMGSEMESFALFYTAQVLNKKAACLLSVVDSIWLKEKIGTKERETALKDMIILALETALKLI